MVLLLVKSILLMEWSSYVLLTMVFDDAFFQPELGWSIWGSLGWTKSAGGLDWRMPDRLGCRGSLLY